MNQAGNNQPAPGVWVHGGSASCNLYPYPNMLPVSCMVDSFPSNFTNFPRGKDCLSRSSMFIITHLSYTVPTLSINVLESRLTLRICTNRSLRILSYKYMRGYGTWIVCSAFQIYMVFAVRTSWKLLPLDMYGMIAFMGYIL